MTDVWDIANFVERHPDDFEQRWRLAKKLYLAWEYRLALEHLQVLRNEWDAKPNVRRYLGATLFRLNRLDEAAKELGDASELWPDDVDILQQLARVQAAAGDTKDAIASWEKILELSPRHEFGPSILKKLRKKLEEGSDGPAPVDHQAARQPAPDTSDAQRRSQFEAGASVICQNCGANNGPEFQTCWQCRGSLEYALPERSHEPTPSERTALPPAESNMPWIALGLVIVALISVGMYFTFLELFPQEPAEDYERVPVTFAEFYQFDMAMTRLALSVILLIGWPVSFRLAELMLGLERVDARRLTGAGLFMSAYAYLAMWLPTPMPLYAAALIPAVTLGICAFAFPAPFFQRALIWLVQGATVILLTGTTIAAFHGFGMVRDLPRVAAHGFERSNEDLFEWSAQVPAELTFAADRQDSAWLNENARRIAVQGAPGPFTRRVFLELAKNGQTLEFIELEPDGTWFIYDDIEAGEVYSLILSGQTGTNATIRIRSLVPVSIRVTDPTAAESVDP